MSFIEYNNYTYIESKYIKVFPCSYRGYYSETENTEVVFDPEARSTTEANFTNTYHRINPVKPSYVVEWTGDTLKCVIGGYYFEIYSYTIDDYIKFGGGSPTLCIKPIGASLGTDADYDGDRNSTILGSYIENEQYLDFKVNNAYIFTGLTLKTAAEAGDVPLTPFRMKDLGKLNSISDYLNKYTYNANTEQYSKITTDEGAAKASEDEEHAFIPELNYAALPITNLLDYGTGQSSFRLLEGEENSTQANGDYSAALGKKTVANNEGDFVVGNNTKSAETGTGYQTVVGRFNEQVEGQFVVGAGSSDTDRKNSLVVDGNTVTVKDTLKVVKDANTNILEVSSVSSRDASINTTNVNIAATAASVAANEVTIQADDLKADIDTLEVAATTTANITVGPKDEENKIIVEAGEGRLAIAAPEVTVNGTNKVLVKSATTEIAVGDNTIAAFSSTGLQINNGLEVTGTTELGTTILGGTTINETLTVTKDTALNGITTISSATISSAGINTINVAIVEDDLTDAEKAEKINEAIGDSEARFDKIIAKTQADIGTANIGTANAVQLNMTASNSKAEINTAAITNAKITNLNVGVDAEHNANSLGSKAVFETLVIGSGSSENSDTTGLCIEDDTKVRLKTYTSSGTTEARTLKQYIADIVYPVGSIYMSMSSANPVNIFGGTWTQIAGGRVLLGATSDNNSVDPTYSFDPESESKSKGGYYETQVAQHQHAISVDSLVNEITAKFNGTATEFSLDHTHSVSGSVNIKARCCGSKDHDILEGYSGVESDGNAEWDNLAKSTYNSTKYIYTYTVDGTTSMPTTSLNMAYTPAGIVELSKKTDLVEPIYTNYFGKDPGTGSNLPPYLVCYIWQRTE